MLVRIANREDPDQNASSNSASNIRILTKDIWFIIIIVQWTGQSI